MSTAEVFSIDPAPSVEEFVLTTIASACNLDRSNLDPQTAMLDVGLDSLTLISIISSVEAIYEVRFSSEKMLELFQATYIDDVVKFIENIRENSFQSNTTLRT